MQQRPERFPFSGFGERVCHLAKVYQVACLHAAKVDLSGMEVESSSEVPSKAAA